MPLSSPSLRKLAVVPRPTPSRLTVPRPQRRASRPSIAPPSAPAPTVPASINAAPADVTEASVVAYLARLSAEDFDAVVTRARAARAELEAAKAKPVEEPKLELPLQPQERRATLPSVDLEVVAESPRRSTPPPLPPRATTPPPPPAVVVAPDAPPQLVVVAPEPPPIDIVAPEPPPVAVSPQPIALPPAPPAPPALSAPDITDLLFDAMTDLPFCDSSVEGGAFCLSSLLRVLPCLAGIVTLVDPDARELVVVYAQGPRADRLLLTRFSDDDALLAQAFAKHEPVIESYDGGASKPRERHASFGEPWSVALAPVVRDGRLLGTIELVDPLDGTPFDARARDAMRYVASQWADLIAERGIRLPRIVAPPQDAATV